MQDMNSNDDLPLVVNTGARLMGRLECERILHEEFIRTIRGMEMDAIECCEPATVNPKTQHRPWLKRKKGRS